ncbi:MULTISPECIES: Uma2 family endonuclease [Kitasatospora]|uniref:Uma2 family endonuclease n=1 Tax=Kitasatospora cathayae TaxID=3004092 RepID=A0ABY7Q9H7_9ACTN|nr:Uma2 family endonuclease [Kitasatospora sp. HUAS 3-15]WBP89345.1 Uma2 family endonuclease [Kitasatospora sp. HUAS 3-15]
MPEVPYDELRWGVVFDAAVQIGDELGGRRRVLSQVLIDFPAAHGPLAPDLAVVAPDAVHNARGRYEAAEVEMVLEVAHPGRDHAWVRACAESGVPLYVVVDPAAEVCTVHTAPDSGGGYREAERVPFGNDLFLPLGDRTLVLQTGGFPTERPTPGTA